MSIKVLVVDDSAVVRQTISRELTAADGIEVVGTAPNPYVARDMIVRLKPDVLTLDIEMPRMDGITFLKKLMHFNPMPVVIVSSLTPAGSKLALDAIDSGAVDVLCKPGSSYSLADLGPQLVHRVRAAARARLDLVRPTPHAGPAPAPTALSVTTSKVIAVGASTGGVTALQTYLTSMPANCPGTLIVQHMPPHFTTSFADRLNSVCAPLVKEAKDGDRVQNGTVLIAPGSDHMVMRRSGANYHVQVVGGPLVNHHRPSVDLLFKSVAKYAGQNALGILMTGMGRDGAEGLLAMKQAGAATIAEDESTCVVYGMPRVAHELGAVDHLLPIEKIAPKAISLL